MLEGLPPVSETEKITLHARDRLRTQKEWECYAVASISKAATNGDFRVVLTLPKDYSEYWSDSIVDTLKKRGYQVIEGTRALIVRWSP